MDLMSNFYVEHILIWGQFNAVLAYFEKGAEKKLAAT
jgi:hypothetical protein